MNTKVSSVCLLLLAFFTVVFLVLLSFSAADARRAIRVTPHQVNFTPQPNDVLLCPWVSWSVPPETPPGSYLLGRCPPHPAPKRFASY